MKKIKHIFRFLFVFAAIHLFLPGCSDMNDLHETYMKDGERIYIGKIDSLKVFPGDECVKLRFWASDPRVKSVKFSWVPNNNSMNVPIRKVSPIDSFEVLIGKKFNTTLIGEENYTFKIVTSDDNGSFSVPFEKVISVYGENYRSGLSNRVLKSTSYNDTDKSLTLNFSNPINEEEIGVKILYNEIGGLQKTLLLTNKEITGAIIITGVDTSAVVSYCSQFLPEPLAIDTFSADVKTVKIP